MKDLPIRYKLLLLAGAPVAGALLLSLLLVTSATEQARKAASLGSIESLAELSDIISTLVHELQTERAETARAIGVRARAALTLDDEGSLAEVAPRARATPSSEDLEERLADQYERTDAARARMDEFLAQRDLSKLPKRLAAQLEAARRVFDKQGVTRASARAAQTQLSEVMEHYTASLAPLIEATAALTELVDHGELLRALTVLVSLMKVKEADAAEHAVVAHALCAGEFAPGAYRDFITLTTAGASYTDVFRTLSTEAGLLKLDELGGDVAEALAIRKQVSEWVEGQAPADADAWFKAQAAKLRYLYELETELNGRVRAIAVSRIEETRHALGVGVGLAALVLCTSLALGWVISYRITRDVHALQAASARIGHGDLTTRFEASSRDELGQLGTAFNEMAQELSAAREAEANQARMARELEIAARLQRALLPPNPQCDGFEFAGRMIPADEVGGDFYDVLTEPEGGALWLTIGDVSNHGLDSGLVMLMAQSAFATQFQADARASADHVLRGVNRVLCENITRRLSDNKYLTAQLLQHRGHGRFECAGGHVSPLVFRGATQQCEVLGAVGPWLGIIDELGDVPVTEIELAEGDVLCLYSDGMTEARNAQGELFDTDGLRSAMTEALRAQSDLGVAADQMIAAVERHAERHDDDWTVLLVRRSC